MNFRLLIQDTYFKVFDEHFFTTIAKTPPWIASSIVSTNYGKRIWNNNLVTKTRNNQDLIFIHIPKCGGNSIENSYQLIGGRHLPASAFLYSDSQRYNTATSFAVIRDPVDRLASTLFHFRSSEHSTEIERAIYNKEGINEDNIEEYMQRVLTDRKFFRKLFIGTQAGRSGLSVSQVDYLTYKNQLLVPNLFTINHIDEVEKWLSQQLGREIKIGHKNSSKRKKKYTPSIEMRSLVEKHLPLDCKLFAKVEELGGFVTKGTNEEAAIRKLLEDNRSK